MPYILDRVAVRGLADAVGYPENPRPQSPWAQRPFAVPWARTLAFAVGFFSQAVVAWQVSVR